MYTAKEWTIPLRPPDGAGQDVFIDQAVQQPGFYILSTPDGQDTTQVALNQNKQESLLDFRDINALKNEWKGDNIKWLSVTDSGGIAVSDSSFPLSEVLCDTGDCDVGDKYVLLPGQGCCGGGVRQRSLVKSVLNEKDLRHTWAVMVLNFWLEYFLVLFKFVFPVF